MRCAGNSEVWQTFDEVGGAIQRIDNPLNILICANVLTAFAGDNSVAGKYLVNGVDNSASAALSTLVTKSLLPFTASTASGSHSFWQYITCL